MTETKIKTKPAKPGFNRSPKGAPRLIVKDAVLKEIEKDGTKLKSDSIAQVGTVVEGEEKKKSSLCVIS